MILDDLLGAILAAHRRDRDVRWLEVLVTALATVVPGEDALAVIEVLAGVELIPTEGLEKRIIAGIRRRWRRAAAQARRRAHREVLEPASVVAQMQGGVTDWKLAAAQKMAARREAWAALVASGEIAPADLRLVWQTRVEGRTVAEMAAAMGITTAAAHKRRRRTEMRLAKLEGGEG